MPILPPGFSVSLLGDGLPDYYARALLEDIGASVNSVGGNDGGHPAKGWADSGLMALTGSRDHAPRICPVPVYCCADGTLDTFRALAGIEVRY